MERRRQEREWTGQYEATASHPRIHSKNLVWHLKIRSCTAWCGSVDWVLACEPKHCQFDSQSGHMPGLQARSPVGGA